MYTTSGDRLIICENSGTFTMVMSTLTMYEGHVSTFEHYLVQARRKQIRTGTAVQTYALLGSYGVNLYLRIV